MRDRYSPFSTFAPRSVGPVVSGGFGRCGCTGPEASCKWCDGTAEAEREWYRAPASWRVAEQARAAAWWAGQETDADEPEGAA